MSVNRYDPEDWGGLHMVPKPDGDWVCYEAWEHVNRQIAALKEENERLKARVAELAAPAVQGEPVAALLIGEPEYTKQGAYQLHLAPQPAEQPEVSVPEIIEAVANFVGSQEGGPFTPAVIKAAIIGQLEYGDAFTKLFTSPAPQPAEQQPAPDVSALVEALEEINGMDRMSYHSLESAQLVARLALAAHRKGGE